MIHPPQKADGDNTWYRNCDNCGMANDLWEDSNYCSTCRFEYQHRVSMNYETRPGGETKEQFTERTGKNIY